MRTVGQQSPKWAYLANDNNCVTHRVLPVKFLLSRPYRKHLTDNITDTEGQPPLTEKNVPMNHHMIFTQSHHSLVRPIIQVKFYRKVKSGSSNSIQLSFGNLNILSETTVISKYTMSNDYKRVFWYPRRTPEFLLIRSRSYYAFIIVRIGKTLRSDVMSIMTSAPAIPRPDSCASEFCFVLA